MYLILNPQNTLLSFRKTPESEKFFVEKEAQTDEADFFSRIRCPLCRWQPTAAARWYCADFGFPEYFFGGCGTAWNTFETGGICPGCNHKWKWTSCLRCGGWSPHEEWYQEESEKS